MPTHKVREKEACASRQAKSHSLDTGVKILRVGHEVFNMMVKAVSPGKRHFSKDLGKVRGPSYTR